MTHTIFATTNKPRHLHKDTDNGDHSVRCFRGAETVELQIRLSQRFTHVALTPEEAKRLAAALLAAVGELEADFLKA